MLEIVDLVRDGGEAVKLREHLASRLYPEVADDVEAVQRAIVLCARGLGDTPIVVAGREGSAGLHIAGLDLERYVEHRLGAPAN